MMGGVCADDRAEDGAAPWCSSRQGHLRPRRRRGHPDDGSGTSGVERERGKRGDGTNGRLGFQREGEGGVITSMEPRDQRHVCIGEANVRAASMAMGMNRRLGEMV